MSDPKPYAPDAKVWMSKTYFCTLPTPLTRYWRVNLLWQAVRFAYINLKMIKVILLSHRGRH
jgi:hypothetical protein